MEQEIEVEAKPVVEMNLKTIKEAVKTTTREVEFKAAGKATGWIWKLRHESSTEVQEVMRQFQTKVRDLALKRKNAQYQTIAAEHEVRLHVAHVVGWRWTQGDDVTQNRPPFSKKELKDMLEDEQFGWHIKNFLDEEVGSLEYFLERSGTNLENA